MAGIELDLERVDVLVCGTGIAECIIASAAARAGKTVLHVDRNAYYGGPYASFALLELEALVRDAVRGPTEPALDPTEQLDTDGEVLTFRPDPSKVRDLLQAFDNFTWRVHEPDVQDTDAATPVHAALTRVSRQFSLDLAPRLLYSRGPLVDLLIATDVSRYLEFKVLDRTFLRLNNAWETVPSSKEDVFQSRLIGVVEKRVLMKFLTFCLTYQNQPAEYAGFEQQPFGDFLAHKRISPLLRNILIYAIALAADDRLPTEEALALIQRNLTSLGRYNDTPFLLPLYGASELSQAFARATAINGGIYILDACPEAFEFQAPTPEQHGPESLVCTAVVLQGGKKLPVSALVASPAYLPVHALQGGNADQFADGPVATYHRMMLVVDGQAPSVFATAAQALGVVPPGEHGNAAAVSLLQLTSDTRTCPADTHLVYLVTAGELADLQAVANALFDMDDRSPWSRTPAAPPATEPEVEADAAAPAVAPTRRGRVLLSVSYRQHVRPGSTVPGAAAGTSTSNVFLAPGPTARWDSEADIASARDWFGRVFPGVPFSAPSHADRGQHFGDDLDDLDDDSRAPTTGTAAAPVAVPDASTDPAPVPVPAPAAPTEPAPAPAPTSDPSPAAASDPAPAPTSDPAPGPAPTDTL